MKINNHKELRAFIDNGQVGLTKKYSAWDLKKATHDINKLNAINSGQDIAADFITYVLPRHLNQKMKLEIYQKQDESEGSRELNISVFCFSLSEIRDIYEYLDSLNQPVIQFVKLGEKASDRQSEH